MSVELAEARRIASEASGGTSSSTIKQCILRYLDETKPQGRLLDYGAGKGELLTTLHQRGGFETLCGMDLFPRSDELSPAIQWIQQDLNDALQTHETFDVVICSETIEHLENPRHTMRSLAKLLAPGGLLILTMPNQESIRSYIGLLLGGHFTMFLGACYPAHITALVRLDLVRMCREVGLTTPRFRYTNEGGIPKLPRVKWQQISWGLLRGRLFSDNLMMVCQKPVG